MASLKLWGATICYCFWSNVRKLFHDGYFSVRLICTWRNSAVEIQAVQRRIYRLNCRLTDSMAEPNSSPWNTHVLIQLIGENEEEEKRKLLIFRHLTLITSSYFSLRVNKIIVRNMFLSDKSVLLSRSVKLRQWVWEEWIRSNGDGSSAQNKHKLGFRFKCTTYIKDTYGAGKLITQS